MEKKVLKFITVDHFEKEEIYLEQMAKKGWHFTKFEKLHYHFESGEPEDVTYQIDYHSTVEGDKGDYIQLFEDSGWTSVFAYPTFDGEWCYFKRQTPSSRLTKIYSDNDSKIDLFKKIRKIWGTFGLIMGFIFLLIVWINSFIVENSILTYIMLIIFAFISVLYIKMVLNLTRKIHHLQN